MEPAVRLADVHAAYEGERRGTLHGIDFAASRGELVAVVGPNGAGKTTLLEVINGLLPVNRGVVSVWGQSMSVAAHRLRRRIGYMPQDLFFPASTPFLVADVVLMAQFAERGVFRWPTRADRARAREAMLTMGISEFARRPIGRLSGGQQRKVLLARTVSQRAALLLLDEPTANLDPTSRKEISDSILEIRDSLGATTFVVSHDAGRLLDAADRTIVLVDGRIAPSNQDQASVAFSVSAGSIGDL
ncbi:metal ABC transporter ATP-binding protein [Candidatus Bipolaricaulota bacterium]|nr:metal ABC transporter ATP-binding protein [Candidatus Bipolaricaulota bacterium]